VCSLLLCVRARRLLRCVLPLFCRSVVLASLAAVAGSFPAEFVVAVILQSSGGLHCDWSLQSGTLVCVVDHGLVVLGCWLGGLSSPFHLLSFRLRIL